ncbi:MAG: carbohydrate ABC transporter permease [Candidatus Margulisbacteria bacterium]|nr:carbohydrate ABC transporter permease [Candidatus Margulisiibacteriota bacterium]
MPYYLRKRIIDIIISIIMLIFLGLTLLPVGWMIFSSLKSSSDIAIGRVGLSRNLTGQVEVHWDNYVDMWKNVNFGLYLKNSLIICGSTMFLAMILSTLAAYALSRFKFPGSDLFSNTILATQMIPAIMYLIPLYIMFVKFTIMTGIPIKGTYLGLILIYSAFFVPFSIWILRGFFASIPKELEEAARIDGCSPLQVFWYIALPLAKPGIIATGIYLFLQAWDELMFAWVLTNGDTMTIPVGIRLFVGNYQNRFDLMMAAATVATIPVVVLFFMLQKHIVRGLTAGAVKG